MKVEILKSFTVGAPGGSTEVVPGDVADVREDLVSMLVADGYVREVSVDDVPGDLVGDASEPAPKSRKGRGSAKRIKLADEVSGSAPDPAAEA